MAATRAIDEAAVEAFVGRALGDLGGTMTTLFCALGDRLGLFKALDADGPVSSEDLAGRLGLNERYVREWLRGMIAAGYLEYEPDSQCFSLPAEHAPVLAAETGPLFFGGVYQELVGSLAALERVTDAFRAGGGAPPGDVPVRSVGGHGALHRRLVRQPAAGRMAAGGARGPREARAGGHRGGRRVRRRPRPDQARRRICELEIQRLRRVRRAARAGPPQRRLRQPRGADHIRASRRRRRGLPEKRRRDHDVRRGP